MAIQYHITVKERVVYVTAEGFDESLEEVEAYGQAVIDACRRHDCIHVLADERKLDYRLSTIDTYELAKYYARVVPTVVKVATVCAPHHVSDATFWETASRNRGLTVRVFTEIDQARRWLGLPTEKRD